MFYRIRLSRGLKVILTTSQQMDEYSLNVKTTTLAFCLSSTKKQIWFLLHWGIVVSNAEPQASDVESTKLIWPISSEETATATGAVEQACSVLSEYKARIKQLETEAEKVEVAIREYMGTKGSLVSVDGKTLVTWRNSKPSKKFASDLFQQAMPDVYQKFVIEMPGSRRFLLK